MEWALDRQKQKADQKDDPKEKRNELNHFPELVANLSKAFALASASEFAQHVKEEVGFFQAVKAGLTKTAAKSKMSAKDKEFAVSQLMSEAIADASIVDVLSAAGMTQRACLHGFQEPLKYQWPFLQLRLGICRTGCEGE